MDTSFTSKKYPNNCKLYIDILSHDVLFSSDYQPEFIFKNQIIKVTSPFVLKPLDESEKCTLHAQTTPTQPLQPKIRRKRSFFLLPFSGTPKKPKKPEYFPFNLEDKAIISGLTENIDDFATHIHLYSPILNPDSIKNEKSIDIRTKETEFYLSILADENLPANSVALEEMKQEFLLGGSSFSLTQNSSANPLTKTGSSSNVLKAGPQTLKNTKKTIQKANIEFCSQEMDLENSLVSDFCLKKVFFSKRKQFLIYMQKYLDRLIKLKSEKLEKMRKDPLYVEPTEAPEMMLFIEQTTKFIRNVFSNYEQFRFFAGKSFNRVTSIVPRSQPFEETKSPSEHEEFVYVEKNNNPGSSSNSSNPSSHSNSNSTSKENKKPSSNNAAQDETFIPGNLFDYPSDNEKLPPGEKYSNCDVYHLEENPSFDDNVAPQMLICQKMHSNGTFSLYFFTEGLGLVFPDENSL